MRDWMTPARLYFINNDNLQDNSVTKTKSIVLEICKFSYALSVRKTWVAIYTHIKTMQGQYCYCTQYSGSVLKWNPVETK